MIKKTTVSAILITSLAGSLFAGANVNLQTIKEQKYYQGVKDANMVYNKNLHTQNTFEMKNKYIKGFIVFKNAKNMTNNQIIRATAIAMKLGYSVDFCIIKGEEAILFTKKDRLPDAKEVAKKLKAFKISTNIIGIDKEVKKINLIGKDAISYIKDFYNDKQREELKQIATMKEYIAKLKEENRDFRVLTENKDMHKIITQNNTKINNQKTVSSKTKPTVKIIKKYVKLDLKNLQVVNRVLTKKYLKQHGIKNKAKISPLNNYAKSRMTIEKVDEKKRIVARNIKHTYKKKIPELNSFAEAYSYITRNAVINKYGKLILNGRVFEKGDRLSKKWIFEKAIYSNGVVIIDDNKNNDYHIVAKR